jgi:hypothetical protein
VAGSATPPRAPGAAALAEFFDLFASRGRFGTLWRNREADKDFEGAIENVKDVITGQASILAFGPFTGGYDDAAIPCAAFGADNIRFPHGRNMRSDPGVFQSENLPQSN